MLALGFVYFQVFLNSQKRWKIGIFEQPRLQFQFFFISQGLIQYIWAASNISNKKGYFLQKKGHIKFQHPLFKLQTFFKKIYNKTIPLVFHKTGAASESRMHFLSRLEPDSLKILKLVISEVHLPSCFVRWQGQSFSTTCGIGTQPNFD